MKIELSTKELKIIRRALATRADWLYDNGRESDSDECDDLRARLSDALTWWNNYGKHGEENVFYSL